MQGQRKGRGQQQQQQQKQRVKHKHKQQQAPVPATGSGMFVLNPPWVLADQLAEALPWLTQHMGEGVPARYQLDSHSE